MVLGLTGAEPFEPKDGLWNMTELLSFLLYERAFKHIPFCRTCAYLRMHLSGQETLLLA